MYKIKYKLTYTQIIAIGFLTVILIGGLLLSLPISSRTGTRTNILDSLFTATSATCVTGLIVFDTYTHWSLFGQTVIITLIQIGGLGVMTIISMFSMFLKHKFSLHERMLLMESTGNMQVSGVVRLLRRILIGTFVMETSGAIVLAMRFCRRMQLSEAIYSAVFHSISAFCNAGFDIMGKYGQFSSLSTYISDPVVNITITTLIITGGLGFFVWNDVMTCKFKFRRFELHTKLVIIVTTLLIIAGTVLFFIFEYKYSLSGLDLRDKLFASYFQSVTPRTAGFNTIDLSKMSESGGLLTIILMFIGGSPGSTAGGIKTTTLAVLILSAIASSRHSNNIVALKKRLDDGVLKHASSIVTVYMTSTLISTLIICAVESFSIKHVLFEVVSAIGTVGLTMGITPVLGHISEIIIMILMYGGRVGGLTLMLVLAEKKQNIPLDRPYEKILIG